MTCQEAVAIGGGVVGLLVWILDPGSRLSLWAYGSRCPGPGGRACYYYSIIFVVILCVTHMVMAVAHPLYMLISLVTYRIYNYNYQNM